MMTLLIFLSVLLVCLNYRSCHGRDTITTDYPLTDNGEKVVSAGKKFELGFFSPPEDNSRYVGIWYSQVQPRTVVWTANIDKPLLDLTGVVTMDEDGNLKVLDANQATYFSTELGISTTSNRSAKLLDSGDLVLIESHSDSELWKSFENPTDTFLPGMVMTDKLKLTSWVNHSNPGTGKFTFQQDQENDKLYIIMNKTNVHWRSGEPGKFFSTGEMPSQIPTLLTNFSTNPKENPKDYRASRFSLKIPNQNKQGLEDYSYTRLFLNSSGQIQFYSWGNLDGWSLKWSEPSDVCGMYNFCGDFGSCSSENEPVCKCFPGFEPLNPERWKAGDFTSGCKTMSAPCSKTNEPDKFLNLKLMKVGKPDLQLPETKNESACRALCLDDCQCQAYSFIANIAARRKEGQIDNAGCWIWKSELKNLQENYTAESRNLSVRVAISDIESTKRGCWPCGATIIPYPLSTGPGCGDPKCNSFYCNDSTGQLDFQISNNSYQIVNVDKEKRSFVIEVKDEIAESCEASAKKIMLNQSVPFVVTNTCSADPLSLRPINSTQSQHRIEIVWNPPSQPTCNSTSDCQDWPDSNCTYTGHGQRRCVCRPTYIWDGSRLNCTTVMQLPNSSNIIDRKKKKTSSSNVRAVIIVAVVIAAIIVVCSLSYFLCKRKMSAERTANAKNPLLYGHNRDQRTMDLMGENERKGTGVPFFQLESILAATENFSDGNKLGEGGFGPVYMGKFPEGQHIAVKRLSSHSGQGMEEFQNEVVLIAKLQHRNLVRLLGYCVERNEKILLYEYMPNKSLDAFIFDKKLCILLDWKKRFDIILGIARGLLYLHQDSRLRIIHRDLKTSNILLDEEMNPKISDFGLARIVDGTQTEANTKRVVGTYGYMSPEYALEGLFSVKSDVFSFGVILLEMVSGMRNTGFYQSQKARNLLGYAWNLWKEDNALDLLDNTLMVSCNKNEVLNCISIGLLCVQEDPSDRPTMGNVITMLGTESATISSPKQPAYVERKCLPSTSSSSSYKTEALTHNELTNTMPEGR